MVDWHADPAGFPPPSELSFLVPRFARTTGTKNDPRVVGHSAVREH
jgi:hypothetical protein